MLPRATRLFLPSVLTLALLATAGVALPANADPAPLPGRIAFVDDQGDLFVIAPDGLGKRGLASGRAVRAVQTGAQEFYSWPAWSPDGKQVAAFHVTAQPDGPVDGLYVFEVATGRVVRSHAARGLSPIYAYWAPDGSRLALLQQAGLAFSLSLWPGPDSSEPKAVATGAPFFFDWDPTGKKILAHVGGDPDSPANHSIAIFDLATSSRTVVSRIPAAYGPASWSPDGSKLAWAETREGNHADLLVGDGTTPGPKPRTIADVTTRTAFAWSPDGEQVAFATTPAGRGPVFEALHVVPAKGGEPRVLARGTIGPFFWSPKGDRILYARIHLEDGDWEWMTVEVASGIERSHTRFLPSRPTRMTFQYFDQYALSHRIWSPDGEAFVFNGLAAGDTAPGDPIVDPKVYVQRIAPGAPATPIARGHTAFWSPR